MRPTAGFVGPVVGAILGTLVLAACVLLAVYKYRLLHNSKRSSATVAAMPPPPKEHVVADSVFSIVAGKGADTISLSALSDWLIERGDTPLDKVQELFNSLDTDSNGSIDRQEWRAGFTAGLLPK